MNRTIRAAFENFLLPTGQHPTGKVPFFRLARTRAFGRYRFGLLLVGTTVVLQETQVLLWESIDAILSQGGAWFEKSACLAVAWLYCRENVVLTDAGHAVIFRAGAYFADVLGDEVVFVAHFAQDVEVVPEAVGGLLRSGLSIAEAANQLVEFS